MTELRLAKKQTAKKNQGGGAGPLPLRRKYVREKIEMKSKHGGNAMTTRTPKLGPLGRAIDELDKKVIHPQFKMGGDEEFALTLAHVEDDREALRLNDPHEAGALLLAEAAQGHPADVLKLADAAHEPEDDVPARKMGEAYRTEDEMRGRRAADAREPGGVPECLTTSKRGRWSWSSGRTGSTSAEPSRRPKPSESSESSRPSGVSSSRTARGSASRRGRRPQPRPTSWPGRGAS